MIWTIFQRECLSHFKGLSFWLLLSASQLMIAWLLFAQLEIYARISEQLIAGQSNLGINDLVIAPTLNSLAILLLFLTPLFSMNSVSQEREQQRLSLLLSMPTSKLQWLLGKFLGSLAPSLIIIAVTLGGISLLALGMQLDITRLLSGAITLILSAILITSIGLMFSSLHLQSSAALASTYISLIVLWLLDSLLAHDSSAYWLALNTHLDFSGSLHSKHLLYFILLSLASFLIAWVQLCKETDAKAFSHWRQWLFRCLICISVAGLGVLVDKSRFEFNLTRQQSLPNALIESVKALDGKITATAYAADYPLLKARISKLMVPLQNLHPQLELNFIDPDKRPDLLKGIDIKQQGEMIIEGMGVTQHVRQLNYLALQKAFTRIARQGEPWVVFLRGHAEADIYKKTSAGISALSDLLSRQGYKSISIDPLSNHSIPKNAALLIIAGPQIDYPSAINEKISQYLKNEGAVLWLNEGAQKHSLYEIAGINTLPGNIVDAAARKAGLDSPLQVPLNTFSKNLFPSPPSQFVLFNKAVALQATDKAWKTVSRFQTSKQSWNETGQLQGDISREPITGEQAGPLNIGFALEKTNSRFVVIGDSDFLRNANMGRYGNQEFTLGIINWLTENNLSTSKLADDLQIHWSAKTAAVITGLLLIVLPILFLLAGLLIQRRRQTV